MAGPEPADQQVAPVPCRSAGDDAVVVCRVAVGLHRSHMPTRRAALEVGALRCARVEGGDDRFAGDRGHMLRAVCPVDDFLRMARRPAAVGAHRNAQVPSADVTAVLRHGGVVRGQALAHRPVLDGAGGAATGAAVELAVPAFGRRQPELEVDRRVAARARHADDPAERRRHRGAAGGRREGRRHLRGMADRGVDQLQVEQAGAVPAGHALGAGHRAGLRNSNRDRVAIAAPAAGDEQGAGGQ